MSCEIKILSNNVKGLQNEGKRRTLFHYFNTSTDANIIMLQETHSTLANEDYWRAEWGGIIKFCHGTSEARGVGTLIKNNIDLKIINIETDQEGRFLQINVNVQGKNITNRC